MTTDEQICRNISEWCGFEMLTERQVGLLFGLDDIEDDTISDYCLNPKSNKKIPEHIPNFLDEIQGLGLLFKYAVPKLHTWEIYPTFIPVGENDSESGVQVEAWLGTKESTVFDKSPTRALALAIHKLIKEDNNG